MKGKSCFNIWSDRTNNNDNDVFNFLNSGNWTKITIEAYSDGIKYCWSKTAMVDKAGKLVIPIRRTYSNAAIITPWAITKCLTSDGVFLQRVIQGRMLYTKQGSKITINIQIQP